MHSFIEKLETPDAPETELVETCPLCESKESEFLFWNCDRFYHLPGKFGLVQCKGCELVRLSPRPTRGAISFYYPDDEYYSYQTPVFSINDIAKRNGFWNRVRD